jgi:hypothetical protein
MCKKKKKEGNKVNFDEYTLTPLGRGRAEITFTEPITRDWEINLFLNFFKKFKKKINIRYCTDPEVKIKSLICHKKTWETFLKKINREEAAVAFEKSMRELDYDEAVQYLEDLKEAGQKEREHSLSKLKTIEHENKRFIKNKKSRRNDGQLSIGREGENLRKGNKQTKDNN